MTAVCHRFPYLTYCDLLEREVDRFIDVVQSSDPTAGVVTCPGWTVSQLVDHVGGLHRWASAHVRRLSPRRVRARELELGTPSDPSGYPQWIRDGIRDLNDALRAADPDADVWAWGSDKHVRFWGRRMLFETTIHRADLEISSGGVPEIEPGVAFDGIDEFLDNLPHATYFAPNVEQLRGSGEHIRLRAADPACSWTIELLPDSFSWNHSDDPDGDASVAGPPGALLLYVYGRHDLSSPQLNAAGDRALLERWGANSAI